MRFILKLLVVILIVVGLVIIAASIVVLDFKRVLVLSWLLWSLL